ncbi:MAG: hypothetical protein AAGH15_11870 [Myxococcota bacterium]
MARLLLLFAMLALACGDDDPPLVGGGSVPGGGGSGGVADGDMDAMTPEGGVADPTCVEPSSLPTLAGEQPFTPTVARAGFVIGPCDAAAIFVVELYANEDELCLPGGPELVLSIPIDDPSVTAGPNFIGMSAAVQISYLDALGRVFGAGFETGGQLSIAFLPARTTAADTPLSFTFVDVTLGPNGVSAAVPVTLTGTLTVPLVFPYTCTDP